jgi:hypothetical protein
MSEKTLDERVSALEGQLAELIDRRVAESFREQAELIDRLFVHRFEEFDKTWDAKLDSKLANLDERLEAKLDERLEAKLETKLAAKLEPIRRDLAVIKHAVSVILTRLP